ncbi:ethanolamine utilization protein [Rhizobium sp. BK418]|uniref:ethanolamine utilization protein n=1 Tax=Rhizobium sp. BK418 TaxID=2512120 RepID=UPI0010526F07|nr:ethanolamine utilization protein [Rhizobium sp. BK418]TCR96275.1 hypothetical protein EV281_11142 [Rhizobium sp. BK418]
MVVRTFTIADAIFERSPGQDGDIFAGNLLDQRDNGPVTIGYGRYGPNAVLEQMIAVHDTMIVIQGRLSIWTERAAFTAGPGDIVSMQSGDKVTIRAHDEGCVTAYVTYPHWQEAE